MLATVVGGRVGLNEIDESASGSGESKRGDLLIAAAGFPDQAGEQVLIQGKGAADPQVTAAVKDVVSRLDAIPGITDIESPLNASDRANTVSEDGRSVAVNFTLRGTDDQVEQLVDAPLAAVAAVQKAHAGVRVEQFGEASATKEIAAQDAKDGQKAHFISYGLMLIILLVAFGAFVAAGVPLVLGATAVAGTVGLLGPLSQIQALAPDVSELVVIIGLAVGVDYAMFYSRRMMEERDKGHSSEAAIEIAAATSGRAVLISGLTVMTAMAGLLFAGNPIFSAFGIGTMLVVAVTVIGSLTFLPAILSFLGEKNWLEKGRVPYVTKRRHQTKGESRVWGAVLTRVLKRPLVSALIAGGVLVALCVPALGLQFKEPGFDGYSRSQPVIQTYDRVQDAFPGGAVPAMTVIKAADVTAAPVQAAIRQLHDQALATGRLSEPSGVEISPDRTVAVVALSVKGSGTDAASDRSLAVLRTEVVPATVGKLAGAEVAVTGLTAGSKDFIDVTTSRLPIVFGFVLSLAFILLLVTFRSIVVPLKAIVLNLLSVGAAYGVLVLIFQDGHGERLLHFESVGGIAPWIPLFLFVILFGLSMDYHVFILSRIREAVDRGMTTDDAVAHGIKSTAGVVTSAALVMVAVFGSFALGSDQVVKQIGIGLAAAILIDATIIRAVLLPATMKLLGARNWYLPKGLGWLPRFEHEPQVAPAR
ncbi:MMPL family transporter [Solirubrobacter soli]|uniref:MMPL family transporter n=1 Tax=Solirubrobacter soli TaxID=363832 RepID=UPI001FDFFEF7|nr:MMPL family transporter [Solirubrobacter soli]